MSTTENTNCISDSDDDLYEQVVEILDGEDVAWIRRAHRTGILRGQELLALILYAIRDLDDPTRDPKKIIRHWAPQLMAYVKRYHYAARHPDSLFPVNPKTVRGWNWAISFNHADEFVDLYGTGFDCSKLVEYLFNSCVDDEGGGTPEQNKEIAMLRDENSKLRSEVGALKKKQDSAVEIITGFAIAKYGYNPRKERNMSLSEMLTDLEEARYPQDKKTLNQFLKRELPPEN